MDTKVARHLRALRWHGIYGHSGGTAFIDTKVARHYIFYIYILCKCDLQLIYSLRASRSLPGQISKYCSWPKRGAHFREINFHVLNPPLGSKTDRFGMENGPIWGSKSIIFDPFLK